jgi:hypothetical protein
MQVSKINDVSRQRSHQSLKWYLILAALVVGMCLPSTVLAQPTLSVQGVNRDGTAPTPVTDYRWVLEEDMTYHVEPGVPDSNTLAVSFHSSYMPVVASGDDTAPLPTLDAAKHYFLSVLPKVAGTYSIGGASIAPDADGNFPATVNVYLNALPIPTAQITIFVFEDTAPINNAPDVPESGLGGFSILVEDAGGRYGASAGQQSLDAFGNPLGTVYERNPDGSPVLDVDGNPVIATYATGPDKGENIVEPMETGPCPGPTCGMLTIKNLAPGKYGIQAVPPGGEGWQQTSTIEGKKVIDAWVKANEPPFFAEFGPPGYHVFIGFVQEFDDIPGGGVADISGQVVNLHLSRPPDSAFYNGAPFAHTTAWVGLNDNAGLAGISDGIYAARANDDGTFTIPSVPPGSYQLVVWDDNMDLIFAFHGVTVNADGSCVTPNGSCNLGDVPVFQWFARVENWVFNDDSGDGFRDPGELGIPEQNVNIRWRDGTIYQAFPTDLDGFVPFDEVFPFFSWLVAEVDFARFKATGVTITVDDGGAIPFSNPWSWEGVLNPQPQKDNANKDYRTDSGVALTEAFQGFIGQTSVFEWGKKAYDPGENGGISGVVLYAVTRAEDDPAYAAAEVWEPGIPRVTVNLYEYDAEAPNFLGAPVATTATDSWDDSIPTGCLEDFEFDPDGPGGAKPNRKLDCYDGMRNWNQVRPGVFDGGYAFDGLASGQYVVEVIPPTGYEIVKEEDRNVDFGDDYVPPPELLPPPCLGSRSEAGLGPVPDDFTLYPLFDENGDPVTPYRVGENTPLCNRKLVSLNDGANAAADFFLFTEVPVAGHIFGFILDDTANEFDPTSPQFGEKFAPPWLPVSIRDWTGREIARTYSDQYGRYNALVPSTYTTNLPAPSGMSPNMLTTCMNDPNLPDGSQDPNFNTQYSTFCYTFQYMPGATTYLDTPVVPVAAFAGADQSPLDCEFPNETPRIKQASVDGGGPYMEASEGTQVITILSEGLVEVPNPAYEGLKAGKGGTEPRLIQRDYGFGADQGTGTVTIGGTALNVTSWSAAGITATIPAGTTTGQLEVIRDNGLKSIYGVTVQVDRRNTNAAGLLTVAVDGSGDHTTIQAAIDAAATNALILVAPGTYEELVVMWKPVQIQGAGSTTISAVKAPAEKLLAWREKVSSLIASAQVDLLPAQEIGFGGIEPDALFTEEGAGIIVLAKDGNGPTTFDKGPNRGARIDGFTITGADTGGGIVLNGYADRVDISNNRIINNSGFFGGGIRVGHPQLTINDGTEYQDGDNDFVTIRHNYISQNGGLGGSGGGVSLCHGSDNYEVSDNWICGNFSLRDGGGIGHLGLSDKGMIRNNTILFNENFNQGISVSGGGISIAGGAPLGAGTLSPGAGQVTVNANLFQGNLAGAGDGGGIYATRINGQDVADNGKTTSSWYKLSIYNNMIVDNVAALAGGGISLQDAARVDIVHNTVANNDSTATAANAFTPADPNQSNPQPAGIVSRAHTTALKDEIDAITNRQGQSQVNPARLRAAYSNPLLVDNIIWHNRSFHFFGDPLDDPPVYKLLPDIGNSEAPVYDDLAVLGAATTDLLNPTYSILTDTTGYDASNISADPAFIFEYVNGNRDATVANPESTTAIQVPPAFDEGGNFIRVRFGPLTLTRTDTGVVYGDYHIQTASNAINAGDPEFGPEPALDFDGEPRPDATSGLADIGADEIQP